MKKIEKYDFHLKIIEILFLNFFQKISKWLKNIIENFLLYQRKII